MSTGPRAIAGRQKGAGAGAVPKVCLLHPEGDIVRQHRADRRARRHEGGVCYHTEIWVFDLDGYEISVVGCAVGASFAVLVAEEDVCLWMLNPNQRHPVGTDHATGRAAVSYCD